MAESLTGLLASERYVVTYFYSEAEFLQFVESEKQRLDCLILQADPGLPPLAHQLRSAAILLPAVIVHFTLAPASTGELYQPPSTPPTLPAAIPRNPALNEAHPTCFYHTAEVKVSGSQLSQIAGYIDQALGEFLNLSPPGSLTNLACDVIITTQLTTEHFLMQQQRRLAEKLRERLGYLGVYYKRNPQRFLRHLPLAERQKFLETLKSDYRQIILNYFSKDDALNQKIDDFVNSAFFGDVPVTNIVEIHMELMDEFAKQLKLEGRSEEVLLDYRLTLIDIIAHLCEMYRRSIPRES
ncbi:MAG: circadian clock protein KaiA [Oscillatoria princeps RMCB-10]|nr:circadian clock protein KaiA [Oscillatoria princeps RMCB-10]